MVGCKRLLPLKPHNPLIRWPTWNHVIIWKLYISAFTILIATILGRVLTSGKSLQHTNTSSLACDSRIFETVMDPSSYINYLLARIRLQTQSKFSQWMFFTFFISFCEEKFKIKQDEICDFAKLLCNQYQTNASFSFL